MTRQPENKSNCLARGSTAPLRVTYRDTDRMGYAYHSQYLVWFEIGRTDLLRNLGTTYKEWEDKEGVYLPVRSCEVKYLVPARYDDLVVVHTQMTDLSRASVTFTYELMSLEQKAVLAKASTVHAFVNKEGRILRIADKLLPALFVSQGGEIQS